MLPDRGQEKKLFRHGKLFYEKGTLKKGKIKTILKSAHSGGKKTMAKLEVEEKKAVV